MQISSYEYITIGDLSKHLSGIVHDRLTPSYFIWKEERRKQKKQIYTICKGWITLKVKRGLAWKKLVLGKKNFCEPGLFQKKKVVEDWMLVLVLLTTCILGFMPIATNGDTYSNDGQCLFDFTFKFFSFDVFLLCLDILLLKSTSQCHLWSVWFDTLCAQLLFLSLFCFCCFVSMISFPADLLSGTREWDVTSITLARFLDFF